MSETSKAGLHAVAVAERIAELKAEVERLRAENERLKAELRDPFRTGWQLYCPHPRCLYRTAGGWCPRHQPKQAA